MGPMQIFHRILPSNYISTSRYFFVVFYVGISLRICSIFYYPNYTILFILYFKIKLDFDPRFKARDSILVKKNFSYNEDYNLYTWYINMLSLYEILCQILYAWFISYFLCVLQFWEFWMIGFILGIICLFHPFI